MTFVDVGAGIGAYTVLAAVLFGGDASVISLESDPQAHFILVWNLKRNWLATECGVRHGVESIASLENAVVSGIDSENTHVVVIRTRAEQVSPAHLAYLCRILGRNPRIHFEYCVSLTGMTIPPLQFLDIVSGGFSLQKVDAESGGCSPVNPEEFVSAFSTNVVVRRV